MLVKMNDSHNFDFGLLMCVVSSIHSSPEVEVATLNHRIVLPALLVTLIHTVEIKDVKEKFGWFRILVIGRANAGKTTILKKICNSTENPEIRDDKGNKVQLYFMLATPQITEGLR